MGNSCNNAPSVHAEKQGKRPTHVLCARKRENLNRETRHEVRSEMDEADLAWLRHALKGPDIACNHDDHQISC